jgi:hypothetical protein
MFGKYNNVRKIDTEVADELHKIAINYFMKENYNTAIIILLEGLQFDKNNNDIVQLLLKCTSHM